MEVRVSKELELVLRYSRDEAMRTGHYGIGVDHLMLGILRLSDAGTTSAFNGLGVNPAEFKDYLDSILFREKAASWNNSELVGFTKGADGALNLSVFESLKWGQQETRPEHLLLAICRTDRCKSRIYLEEHGLNHGILTEYFKQRGILSQEKDPIMPKAEEIATALEQELRKVIGIFPIKNQDIYS